MSTPTLFSAPSCPFAQRSRLVCGEKGVAYDLREIDLQNTPDWYYAISPSGKVPCLQHGQHTVLESAVINEYLEEAFPQSPLLPKDPGDRAYCRYVIARTDQALIPAFYKLLLEQHRENRDHRRAALAEALMELNGLIRGAWFAGDAFSLADLTLYPFLERFGMLRHYRDAVIPEEAGALKAWLARMRERGSVRSLMQPNAFYIDAYSHYADGSAEGITAREMRDA